MTRILGCAASLAVLAIAGVSCGRDGGGPVAGNLLVRLTSPNSGADSAIVLTITGPAPLTSVVPTTGLRAFPQPLGQTSTKIALVGRLLTDATIITIGVSNVEQVSQYSATIQGIAQPNYQLRLLPGGYSLAVVR